MYEERSVNTISYILCLYDVHVVWFSDVRCLCFKAYFTTQMHATVVLMVVWVGNLVSCTLAKRLNRCLA